MRADALAEIGGFDETLRRGEDWELNHRLRRPVTLVWLDPTLRVNYWPRSTGARCARQFFATGVWRGELVRRLRRRNSPRFFAPPVLVVATGAAVVLVPARRRRRLRALAGGRARPVGLRRTAGGARRPRRRRRPARSGALRGVLATMHYAWGAGFLTGCAPARGDTVDTRAHRRRVSPASPRRRSGARPARRPRRRRTA